MIYKIGRKNFDFYAWDIESHNDIESIKKLETSMWLGCLINEDSQVDDEKSYHYTMDEFIERIETMSSRGRKDPRKKRPVKNICIYIYNLSFEWSFLLPVLLEHGYKVKENIEKEDTKVITSVTTKTVSSVWEVNIKYKKTSGIIKLRDLSKIFGGGLGKVAKSFGLETQKGEIDYRLNRLHGHIVTKEEKEYCFKDTRIVMEILLKMKEREDKFFFKSMSMASYSMLMMIKRGWPRSIKPYHAFREMYPELDQEESAFLRKSVAGGICYACPNYQFKQINRKVIHIDAHSMHPSSAYINPFPYGKGEYHQGKPEKYMNRINCCHIKVTYSGVKLHSVISLIGFEFIADKEITVWDFEIETMMKCYEQLEIEYIDYYSYPIKALKWRQYYADCFLKRLEAKEQGDSFNVLYYKLLMNSSYGKLLENAHTRTFINIIGEDGIIDSVIENKIKPEEMTEEQWLNKMINAKYTYLPVGSCIPAYSRVCLVELALKIGWEKICYFDTDSIFFIEDEESVSNMNKYMNKENFLGGWAIEEILAKSQYTASKRYKGQKEDGTAYFKMGGFNLIQYAKERGIEIKDIPYDEVNIISSKWRVQRAFRVKGGTIIDFQDKEVSVPKKYIEIYNRNCDNINDE